MLFSRKKIVIYLASMTTANGENHQQQQIADGKLFMRKVMDDDKLHFVQAEQSTSQVFPFIVTFFSFYIHTSGIVYCSIQHCRE